MGWCRRKGRAHAIHHLVSDWLFALTQWDVAVVRTNHKRTCWWMRRHPISVRLLLYRPTEKVSAGADGFFSRCPLHDSDSYGGCVTRPTQYSLARICHKDALNYYFICCIQYYGVIRVERVKVCWVVGSQSICPSLFSPSHPPTPSLSSISPSHPPTVHLFLP